MAIGRHLTDGSFTRHFLSTSPGQPGIRASCQPIQSYGVLAVFLKDLVIAILKFVEYSAWRRIDRFDNGIAALVSALVDAQMSSPMDFKD